VSRRGISVLDDERWVFNRLAPDYAARPGYPAALVARLLELGGGPGARVAELGAGTGLLALPLARAGARLHAVEPARAMLAALGHAAAGLPGVTTVHAAGEATGLTASGFDLVVLADALHWVDAAAAGREAARLLVPGGVAAVVEPRLAASPFLDALGARLAQANPRARPAPPPLERFFAHLGGSPPALEPFCHEERLAPERLEAVLRSLSLVGPALGPDALAALLRDARALAEAHGGAVWRRELRLHWARRR
jgi:SAM-dependent methyltransferase